MPTDPANRAARFFATGNFREGPGYGADRPTGGHDWLLIITLRGRGLITDNTRDFTVGPGDALLLAPGKPHRYGTAPNRTSGRKNGLWEFLFAHFAPSPHWMELLRWPDPEHGAMKLSLPAGSVRQRAIGALREADRLAKSATPYRERKVLNQIENALLWCNDAAENTNEPIFDPRIRAALNYIYRHLNQPLDVPTLSRIANLSPSRFAHLFLDTVGMTPIQAIEVERLRHASHLLTNTDLPIHQISRRCGFREAFYFSRRFRLATQQSPTQFRAAARIGQATESE